MPHCMGCKDTGWVCEAHPNKPWSGPSACLCGSSGMPCPRCSADADWNADPDFPPDVRGVFRSVTRVGGKKVS